MFLICGDLHLTEHSRDEYRFAIFEWIRKQQVKFKPLVTILLGDITDAKDKHSATLVNKIVGGLVQLAPPVYILQGNHDYKADQANPFFKFLSHIDGLTFVTAPTEVTYGHRLAMIPHYRSQAEFDQAVEACSQSKCFFVHQTFEGAIAESGVRLSGLSASLIESLKPPLGIYAGDVHRPQTQGIVTYVGCPYQVRFGDDFEPRTIFVNKAGTESYPWFEAPRKWALTVRGPENLLNRQDLLAGDQVKLTIEMAREEAVEWKKVKQDVLAACKELKLDVYGVKLEINSGPQRERIKMQGKQSNVDTFSLFCKTEKVSTRVRQAGREFIDGNT